MVEIPNIRKACMSVDSPKAEDTDGAEIRERGSGWGIRMHITNQLSGLLESCGFEHPITARASLGVLAARTTCNRSLLR